ncbi:hypothetical protein AB0B54_32535 [Microbispora bryophytorum]|uniref:hypothetical protein n=1 Tax=Microbispora bryophytorum TaxID=1460882 RepID=UPI0033FC4D2B
MIVIDGGTLLGIAQELVAYSTSAALLDEYLFVLLPRQPIFLPEVILVTLPAVPLRVSRPSRRHLPSKLFLIPPRPFLAIFLLALLLFG